MAKDRVSPIGWLMLILGFIVTVVQLLATLAPAGLMTAIMADTGWSVMKAGNIITIAGLIGGIFIFSGSPLLDKFGVVKTSFIGLLLMGVANLLAVVFGDNYGLQIAARLLFGAGGGFIANIPAMIIAIWFPPTQQSALQGARTAVMYLGMALAFYIILPIFSAVNQSWQWTLGVFGIFFIVLAFLFLIFGKEKRPEAAAHAPQAAAAAAPPVKQESGLRQAARRKEMWMITIAMFFILWSFNCYNTYFATFLQSVRGLDATTASSFTGLMPIAGIISGVVCGAISSATGRRNLVSWPLIILMMAGYVGATLLDPNASRSLFMACLLVGGFGASGFTIYYCTVPAEWKNTNSSLIAGSLAIMIGTGSRAAVLIPFVSGGLTKAIGMQNTMLWMHLPLAVSIAVLLPLKETGPGRRKKEPAEAETGQKAV